MISFFCGCVAEYDPLIGGFVITSMCSGHAEMTREGQDEHGED